MRICKIIGDCEKSVVDMTRDSDRIDDIETQSHLEVEPRQQQTTVVGRGVASRITLATRDTGGLTD